MKQLTRSVTTSLCAVVWLLAVVTPAQGQRAPYDLEKFRSVLDDSKLQAPTSSPTKIDRGDFAGASNEYFFLDKTGRFMTFTVQGEGNRSELRQSTGDWDTATETPQYLTARVRVLVPEDRGLEQFTFLQIHDKKNDNEGLNKPLLRVTRHGRYRGTNDHLWAHIRTPKNFNQPISLSNLGTKNIDLGPRPKGFFNAQVRVQNSRMIVAIDG